MRISDESVPRATRVRGYYIQDPGNDEPSEAVPEEVLNDHIQSIAQSAAGHLQNSLQYVIAESTSDPSAGYVHFATGITVTVRIHKKSIQFLHEQLPFLKSGAVFMMYDRSGSGAYIRGILTGDPVLTGDIYTFQMSDWIIFNYHEVTAANENVCIEFRSPVTSSTPTMSSSFNVIHSAGSTYIAGRPYYLTSYDSVSGCYTISKARANSKATCSNVVVLTQDLPADVPGIAIALGNADNVDMSSYASGVTLYVSPDTEGEWTTVEPGFPYISCRGGMVGHAVTSGTLAVMVDTDPTFKEGTASTTEQLETFSIAVTNQSTQVQSGQASQWSMTASMILPKDIVNISTASKLTAFISQGTGSFMMAIYKKESDHSLTRLAYTPIIAATGNGFYSGNLTVDAQFSAADTLYFAILTSANSLYFRGISSFLSNTPPYVNGRKTNMGTLTVPPTSVVFDGEFGSAVYMQLER